ncbi:MAG TPA: hypothetical protein VNH42_06990, partial [Mariprofundaceae bacterium]|nr:hypothetical protein [Mariprofundaceae bacterium]
KAEARLSMRNREVLLAAGREAAERIVEREFDRVGAAVNRSLAEYPALKREASEEITKIEEEHQQSSEVPPTPPAWHKAVEAVAKIPSSGDSMVAGVLEEIHKSMVKAQDKTVEEFRKSSHKRHQLLAKMLPHCRRLVHVMERTDKSVSSLLDRSKSIDRHMQDHEEILKGSDRAVQMLSSSSITQFFISALVLVIAVGGAVINFHLIMRPMQEMVGGNSYIMGFRTANVAALVIIFVEMAMGLFLMESMRITRLFPVIGALDDKKRVRMIWATFAMLFILASIEASLAYMRDILSQDDAALLASLAAQQQQAGSSAASSRWITTAAQMGMGFILPFALTFVAIPLESFIHSLRTVLGIAGGYMLNALAVTLRAIGNMSRFAGRALVQIYDLAIFAPLWVERMLKGRTPAQGKEKAHAYGADAPMELGQVGR